MTDMVFVFACKHPELRLLHAIERLATQELLRFHRSKRQMMFANESTRPMHGLLAGSEWWDA